MIGDRHRRLLAACIVALLAAGCSPPATFIVETIVRPDGSCDRTITQPRNESLPPEAFRPEWVARWASIKSLKGPPARPGQKAGTEDYFSARGSFANPGEIPPHYRRVANDDPDGRMGSSVLERTYERIDRGFVVDHRWSERVTDVVTFTGFLEARDRLLDIGLPMALRGIADEFGSEYDIDGLSTFVRKDVRGALEESSLLFYDYRLRRHDHESEVDDADMVRRLGGIWKRCGLDFLDAKGAIVAEEEMGRRLKDNVRDLILKHVRHRDGRPVDRSEADALIEKAIADPKFMKLDKRQEERLDRFVKPLIPRFMGLYGFPMNFLNPRFAFTLQLPGELIESGGLLLGGGRTRWSFDGRQIFPDGYTMKARSLEIDRDGQKKALGRVAIENVEDALEFLDLLGDDEVLIAAVRKLRATGDRHALDDQEGWSYQQKLQAQRVRDSLFNPPVPPNPKIDRVRER